MPVRTHRAVTQNSRRRRLLRRQIDVPEGAPLVKQSSAKPKAVFLPGSAKASCVMAREKKNSA
jgi:hypothetical protein